MRSPTKKLKSRSQRTLTGQEFKDIDWSDALLMIPARKKAISIRVDEDVLDFFKSQGDGYQRRINAVLRSYMQQKAKPKKRA